jgi:hypothetical protein
VQLAQQNQSKRKISFLSDINAKLAISWVVIKPEAAMGLSMAAGLMVTTPRGQCCF